MQVGGEPEQVEKVWAILSTFGNPILHLGPIGAGMTAKVIQNAVTHANFCVACEALAVAAKADMDIEKLLQIMGKVGSKSWIVEHAIPAYLENCRTWIGPWVRARRNHPRVVLWNATNEMVLPEFSRMTGSDLKTLGDEIRKHDATRPVNYDGDGDVGDALVNLHYPETDLNTLFPV